MGIADDFAAWCLQADFSAVAAHSSSIPAMALRAIAVTVDSVVVFAQHGQVLGIRLATILVCLYVVDLAAVCWDVAVGPGAHQVFGHC